MKYLSITIQLLYNYYTINYIGTTRKRPRDPDNKSVSESSSKKRKKLQILNTTSNNDECDKSTTKSYVICDNFTITLW